MTDSNTSVPFLLADTNDIGVVDSVNVTNQGFKYTVAPEGRFRANFLLKDVSGTFVATNTLTTHSGTVKSFDGSSQHLEVDFDLVENIKIEAEVDVNEGIQLEQSIPTGKHILFDNILLKYSFIIIVKFNSVTICHPRNKI